VERNRRKAEPGAGPGDVRRFLEVYQEVTRLVSMVLDHQQVMDTVVTRLPALLGVDACTIRLLDPSTATFVLGAAHGLSLEYLGRPSIDTEATLEMIRAGRPVLKLDVDQDPDYRDREAARREGIKSVLTLPIRFQEEIIGMMRLLCRSNRPFGREEIAFAMALAEQVGIAISNARMFQEMRSQLTFLREIQEISRLVSQTLDLQAVLRTVVERIPATLACRGCTIRLLKPQTNTLELVAAHGVSEAYLRRGRIEKERNTMLVLSGEPVAIYDVLRDERIRYKAHMAKEGICSLLAVPIKKGGEVIGVMRILSDTPRFFTPSEIHFAMALAETSGAAIQNARTYAQINLLYRQIEENERFLSNILDCIRPQLVVVDRDRRIVLANRVFLDAHGKRESEVLGARYQDVCGRRLQGLEVCPVRQVLESGRPAVVEHEVCHGGRQAWLERTATPMTGVDGRVEYVIEVIRDVTVRRRLENERLRRIKLEGVVETAGAVAHELNTPLFAALGAARLVEEAAGEELRDESAMLIRNLKKIEALTRKMVAMTGFQSKAYVGDTRIVDLE